MSDYVDRLERELLAAGHRSLMSRPAPRPARRGTMFAIALSSGVTAAVVAVVILTGVGSSTRSPGGDHPGAPIQPGLSTPTIDRACRSRHAGGRLVAPRMRYSSGKPGKALLDELAVLRTPQLAHSGLSKKQLGGGSGNEVLRIYRRYVRVLAGPKSTRIVLVPARVCLPRESGNRQVIAPQQTLLMQLLGPEFANDAKEPPSIVVGTAQQIAQGSVFPGMDADNRAWMQVVVVPDNVTRVRLHFTPPFRPAYTRTLKVHDNIAVAFPLPAYTPTTSTWFNAAGRLIHRYVDHTALRYDNCLRHHRKTCT